MCSKEVKEKSVVGEAGGRRRMPMWWDAQSHRAEWARLFTLISFLIQIRASDAEIDH